VYATMSAARAGGWRPRGAAVDLVDLTIRSRGERGEDEVGDRVSVGARASEENRPHTSIGGRGSTGVASGVAEKFSWSGMSSAVRCRTQGAFAPSPHMPVIVCVGITMTTPIGFCARSACLERFTGNAVFTAKPFPVML
jgi:hypothetical protein